MTPEGKVKAKLKATLKKIPRCYPFWPVQMGLGASTLDLLLCANGYFFAIETKAGDNTLTARQEQVRKQIEDAGGTVYVVTGKTDFSALEQQIRTDACL